MSSRIQIISARWIVPVVPRETVLEHHSLVIEGGRILAIIPTQQAIKQYPDAETFERPYHVLIPGLINAHTHASMTLLRGYGDDMALMDWLQNRMWPAEARWVDPEFINDGCELAIAEMLLSGTTCFSDMYFFPDVVARRAQDLGIRAMVGMIMLDFPTAWGSGPDDYLEKSFKVHDEARSLSHVHTAYAPHAPYTVADEALQKIRTYADELHIPIHMHVHETREEVEQAVEQSGIRPLQRLHQLGLLTPKMIAVHMTQLTPDEIELVAIQGVHVAHCPQSNAKLASGCCPVNDLLSAGINVCLGTDGTSSNNNLDMLEEMQTAALAAKDLSGDATVLPAWQALELATINGAKALNLQEDIGSLEEGKSADVVAIDLNHVSTQPVYNPISQIVYSACRDQVSDVWVSGRQLVHNRALTEMDLDAILHKAANWGQRISDQGNHDNV